MLDTDKDPKLFAHYIGTTTCIEKEPVILAGTVDIHVNEYVSKKEDQANVLCSNTYYLLTSHSYLCILTDPAAERMTQQ